MNSCNCLIKVADRGPLFRMSQDTRMNARSFRTVALAVLIALGAARFARAAGEPVRIVEDQSSYTLDNGTLQAMVSKRSGGLVSLKYNGLETLDAGSDHTPGYWSHAAGGPSVIDSITIDPTKTAGERGEVSVKAVSGGEAMGRGPGGSVVADIEIRYSLGRGDSGLYTYSILTHKSEYPATSLGEARFCAKLSDAVFDWMTVDADRNMKVITTYDWNHGTVMNMKEARLMNSGQYKGQVEHKYDYSANQFDTLAWGWSSTAHHVGLWFVNPTIEYLSGGPTKVELSAHRDATFGTNPNAPAPPCLLNYWRGSHYGGSSCVVAAGEEWTKVVGPFLIYCNAGATPDAMWKDALARADKESAAWPYEWVAGVDYPHKPQRAKVSGEIALVDPGMPGSKMSHLLVGLTAPDYKISGRRGPSTVDWQLDAKHYEFWTRGDHSGRFAIANVRPGEYTLHAIADGVLGEFTQAEVTVKPGGSLDLGHLEWKPVRYGRQLWDIGIPDRTAREFLHGDHFWQWGLYDQYPKDFPNDVNYVIGKSDYHKDWNYCQCPRADRPEGTTWSITFDLPEAPHGKATLRLAFAATSARSLTVGINDKPAGDVTGLPDTATIRRDGIRGYWTARDVAFDAGLLKQGTNVLKLTIPPGNPMSGIEYDYLRLELDGS
jgi:rhamnogalacturonan endolyase